MPAPLLSLLFLPALAAADPCAGIGRELAEADRTALAPLIGRQLDLRGVTIRESLRSGDWRVELHRVKNAAYAWRQMVFFLSLLPSDAPVFLTEAQALLDKQPAAFAKRFQPALDGLRMAVEEPHHWTDSPEPAPFLGWWQTDRWRTPPQGS